MNHGSRNMAVSSLVKKGKHILVVWMLLSTLVLSCEASSRCERAFDCAHIKKWHKEVSRELNFSELQDFCRSSGNKVRNKRDLRSPEMAVFGRFSSMFNINESKSVPPEDIPFVVPRRPSRLSLLASRSAEERALIDSLNLELYVSAEGDEYFYGENHIGRIWFEIEFDAEREKLFVWVGKVRNLPCRSEASSRSAADRLRDPNDFFLRVYLSPFGDKCFAQTKTRRRTLNPTFDELFTFELSPVHFDERYLKIVAYRVDAFKRTKPVGHVLYALSEYSLKKKKHLEIWRDFEKDESESQSLSSELLCSLVYNDSIERLTLTIGQARDLDLCGSPESWSVYLKVELCLGTRRIKSRRSNTVRRTRSPVFNESFNFKLSSDKLDQASLIVLVCQSKPDKVIARLILGGVMFTRNKPLQQWQDMMANMKTVISEWHFLTE